MRNPIARRLTARLTQRFQHLAHGYADPGKLMLLASPGAGNVAASDRLWITVAGLEIHSRKLSDTGQMVVSPCNGSRIIALTKEEAARFSLPGRTQIVGKRSASPST